MALRFSGFGTKKSEEQMLLAIDDLIKYLQEEDSKPIENLLLPIQKAAANIIFAILFSKHMFWDEPQLQEIIADVELFLQQFTGFVMLADAAPKWIRPLLFGRMIKRLEDKGLVLKEKYTLPYVKEHTQSFDHSNIRDFIDYYLQGENISEAQLAEYCFTFFPDAVITTSQLIMWNILYLAQYPDMQSKIQKELDEELGSQRPSTASRAHLHYSEAFIWEAVRHSCIVTFTPMHKPLHDTTLDGYHIPKDASVMANLWSVNMDPRIWPEPEKFKPERHIDENGCFVKLDNVNIFGQGCRMCLGEQLVKTEVFMFVTSLLQHFTFRFPEDDPHPDIKCPSNGFIRPPPQCHVCALPR